MPINVSTLTTSDGTRNLAERILVKEFLKRPEERGALLQKKAYGLSKPMPSNEGTYLRFTRKQNIPQPETDPMTSGQSSDPAAGFTLNADQVLLPIESHRQFAVIDQRAAKTSWIDIKSWVREDMGGIAWPRRANRLLWNALVNGRMTPGVYASNGTISTPFDRTAATSLSLDGITFTFDALPRAYGNGKQSFLDVTDADYLTWADIRSAWVALDLSLAPKINGKDGPGYVCALSGSQWNDLLQDNDNGNLTAVRAGGLRSAIEGLEGQSVFFYAGTYFVIESDPFTMDGAANGVGGDSVARAQWGNRHCAAMFGQEAYGMTNLGGDKIADFKIQDITKTGAEFTIGARIHWNCRVVNPNWGRVIISAVRVTKPNNWSASNQQTHGFNLA